MENSNQPNRIAQILGIKNKGGVESVLMNFYREIDRDKYQFDFYIEEGSDLYLQNEIIALGGKIFMTKSVKNPIAYMKQLTEFFNNQKYSIVHIQKNSLSVFAARAAKKAKIPNIIIHSQSMAGSGKGEFIRNLVKALLKLFSNRYSNCSIACSNDAGKWLFGRKSQFHIIRNAINLNNFKFNEQLRKEKRQELGINDELVIGHIGRFEPQKNQRFILDVFEKLLKKKPESKLILIGGGSLENELRKIIMLKKIEKSVIILIGAKSSEWYHAFDIFLLPSLYEGIPLVGIEAQASGLPCIFSNRISEDVKINDYSKFIPLSNNTDIWVDTILNIPTKIDRLACYERVENSGYSVQKEVKNMEKIYYSLIDKTNQ